MNVQQYTGVGHQQTFHQDVGPILQQFAAKFTTNGNDGLAAGAGLVVMGSDGVRYHCTAANPTTHFLNQSNTHPSLKHALMMPHVQSQSFVNSIQQENQLDSPNNQCFSNNAASQKTDASTMTEKETQTPNESFINQLIQQECSKSQLTHYPVTSMVPSHSWQSLAGPPGSTVAEYLSRLPASTLPYTLHHFLKFSSSPESIPSVKREDGILTKKKKKRKYKKKPYIPRPPRPKPGEIRLTTALDGSTLYCCPECQMAYPEKSLLEQHLVVHRLERRFVCDICGAGLKRKEHLDRHKQGHNPQRPFICTVCMKAFKRNEHLSRHFIIHSGDKSQVCMDCGKAFFRKDHLRKHSQSHIAKRLRSELMGQKGHQVTTQQSLVSIGSSMDAMGTPCPPQGVSAIALMPGGATVPILTS